jgi:hypothetical protein
MRRRVFKVERVLKVLKEVYQAIGDNPCCTR